MPRRARLNLPGIPWHIIQRGNNRTVCFYAEEDYRRYLDELTGLAARFGCAVHAYALMTNHVHLLLTPERSDSAALLMKHLGQRYVQYVNRTYGRSGTLWEGRFRSCLTQAEDYVLACYRYIELNPVRAGMVRQPRDYRWTSYHANADGRRDALITAHDQYLRLGRAGESRREAYRALFKAHVDDDTMHRIRAATNGNYVLGGQRFEAEIAAALKRRVARGKAGRPKKSVDERDRLRSTRRQNDRERGLSPVVIRAGGGGRRAAAGSGAPRPARSREEPRAAAGTDGTGPLGRQG